MTESADRRPRAPTARTKIVATVGPACDDADSLRQLILAGVSVFRLNFAHADHAKLSGIVETIRRLDGELEQPITILGDLAGPKIRLGEVDESGLRLDEGMRVTFAREANPDDPLVLTSSYDGIVDDLDIDDAVMLADGTVGLRVVAKHGDSVECVVEQPGLLRSRAGINLPGVKLKLPALTDKDLDDLRWAVEHELDFLGLSFVRSVDDLRDLRQRLDRLQASRRPGVVAKIEKSEAVDTLDELLDEADAIMVARGDLGVEVDIARVPAIQKRIIRTCNDRRVPVITATQMLESMQERELPTRAEASDVANAVLDGSDAVMLSGETAVGRHPLRVVRTMRRIICDAEQFVPSRKVAAIDTGSRHLATQITRGVTLGALHAAELIRANLIVVLTRGGKTAIAVSALRGRMPILALTDNPVAARRLGLVWGVLPVVTDVCDRPPLEVFRFVNQWGRQRELVQPGDRVVLIGTTDWTRESKDLLLVHEIS